MRVRYLLPVFTIVLFISCSRDKEPIDRLIGFEYPLDSLDEGRRFVYKRTPGPDYLYVELTHIKEGGVDFLLEDSYTNDQRTSFNKYKITDKQKEWIVSEMFSYPDSLSKDFVKDQTELLEIRNLRDNKKYTGRYYELRILTQNNFSGENKVTDVFNRADTLTVLGQKTDVIIFFTSMEVSARYRYLPFFSSKTNYIGETIFGRGLGWVKFNSKAEGEEMMEWELVEIQKMSKAPAVN